MKYTELSLRRCFIFFAVISIRDSLHICLTYANLILSTFQVQLQQKIKQESEQFRAWKASREKEVMQVYLTFQFVAN